MNRFRRSTSQRPFSKEIDFMMTIKPWKRSSFRSFPVDSQEKVKHLDAICRFELQYKDLPIAIEGGVSIGFLNIRRIFFFFVF